MRRTALAMALALALSGCAGSGDDRRADGGAAGATTTPIETTPPETPPTTPTTSPTTTPEPEPADAPFRFLAIGDFGDGSPEQYAIADRMCAVLQRRPFDTVVTTGDNVYDVGSADRFDEVFFRPYDCLFDRGVSFRATLGNHDVETDNGRPELNEPAFGFEGRNYVFRKGGVRFVMADSNDLNRDWLRRALVAREGDRWTIVVFHHSVYSSGEYGPTPGYLPGLPRMFRRKGVDLVLNGHEHHYEVSNELRGIRYVVTGGGGASVRSCGEPRWFTNVCIGKRFHFLEILAGEDQIEVRALPARGPSFHSFTTTGRD